MPEEKPMVRKTKDGRTVLIMGEEYSKEAAKEDLKAFEKNPLRHQGRKAYRH